MRGNKTHGYTCEGKVPKVYSVWREMRMRCQNPNHEGYADYGGRGITVCPEWDSFEQFLSDMGERPKGMTLDRRDNNKGYSKNNCRWATYKTQAQNTRRNINLTHDDCTYCIAKWAREVGISAGVIQYRIHHGWTVEQALFIKPHHRTPF